MTGLLVSVRDAAEARAALVGGADLIDVKEPLRGALGYALPTVWSEVLEAVGAAVPCSVALGELLTDPVAELAPQTAGFAFAKVGLAGCSDCPDWQTRWHSALSLLPASVSPVAVAYADSDAAHAPLPEQVLAAAAECSIKLLLLDTCDKRAGRLLDHLPLPELARLITAAHERGIAVVLAGSLTLEMFHQLLPLTPRYLAVRGAACRAGRTSAIDASLVKQLAATLPGEQHSKKNA